MNFRTNVLRSIALTALMSLGVPAHAKTVTIGDIKIDVPETFTASESSRGVETKTSDEEVFVWFETFKGNEMQDLIKEHEKYWAENQVVGHEPTESVVDKPGQPKVVNTDFKKATWKGDPTVLRYSELGPIGSENTMVLVTLWASPEGDEKYSKDVSGMVKSLNVKYKE